MKSIILSTALAMTMMFGSAAIVGCSKGGGDNCKALAKKICDGKDDAYCKKAEVWVMKQMDGPDGKPLSKSQASEGCKMIKNDDKVLSLYKKKAEKDLGKKADPKKADPKKK